MKRSISESSTPSFRSSIKQPILGCNHATPACVNGACIHDNKTCKKCYQHKRNLIENETEKAYRRGRCKNSLIVFLGVIRKNAVLKTCVNRDIRKIFVNYILWTRHFDFWSPLSLPSTEEVFCAILLHTRYQKKLAGLIEFGAEQKLIDATKRIIANHAEVIARGSSITSVVYGFMKYEKEFKE
jgi:hypothetical protein